MEKNIKIADLVKKLSSMKEAEKLDYIKKNIKSESYVPWAEKVVLATNIVNATTYSLEKKEDRKLHPTSVIEVNSNNRLVLFVMRVIDKWTNIQFSEDDKDFMKDFDDLNRLGVIDIIMNPKNGIIPARELNEFNTVVENCYSDTMTNSYENHAFISNQITRITDVAKVLIEPLVEKLDGMNDKQIDKLLGTLDKAVSKFKI